MLTPEYLARVASRMLELSQLVEDELLADAARRISKMDTITDTAAYQLWCRQESTAYRRDVIRSLTQLTKKSPSVLRETFKAAGIESLANDDVIHLAAGKKPPSIEGDETLLNILRSGMKQTQRLFKNLTQTTIAKNGNIYMPQSATRQFIAACDHAWYQVSSGGFTYQQAIKQAILSISHSGIASVTYPTGHVDPLDVAVRRAVLTGVNQTCSKLQLARGDELGCEFVETSAHAGARPEHAYWQGQVFHRGGSIDYMGKHYRDFETVTGYGTGPGLCGWNCRHSFYPFWPELSKPAYSKSELDKLKARNIEYNGKKYSQYEIDQMQRSRERDVRTAKRDYIAVNSAGLDTTKESVKLADARASLKDLCLKTGNRLDPVRTGNVAFGRSEASKAVWNYRKTMTASDYWVDRRIPNSYHRITSSSIQSVRIPTSALFSRVQCKELRKMGRDLLRMVENHDVGTEGFITATLQLDELNRGIGKIGMVQLPRYSIEYISLHNHPSGLLFSPADIDTFVMNENMRATGVVGNNGSFYLLEKLKGFRASDFAAHYTDVLSHHAQNAQTALEALNIAIEIVEGSDRYGLHFGASF